MKVFGSATVSLLLGLGAAYGNPIAAPGTDDLCRGYDETIEGVWLDGEVPALLFRLARNEDETACYAWLNAYEKWNTPGPGKIDPGPVQNNGVIWRNRNGSIYVDIGEKSAIYDWQGARADGKVFD